MDTRQDDRENLGFYRARLSDSDVLYDVIDPEVCPGAIAIIIGMLKNSNYYVFISATDDAIIAYEPVLGDVPWITVHSWTKKSGRGKKLKEFYWRTGIWVIENTEYTTICAIVPDEFRMHGLFLAACGAVRQCYVDETTMYTFNYKDLKETKEKLKCLN